MSIIGKNVFNYEDRSLIISYCRLSMAYTKLTTVTLPFKIPDNKKVQSTIATTKLQPRNEPRLYDGIFQHDGKSELKWKISGCLSKKLCRIEPVNEEINKRFTYILSIDVNNKEFYGPSVYDGTTFQWGLPANDVYSMQIKILYPYEAITFCACALEKSQEAIVQEQSVATLPRMLTKATSRKEYADVKFSVEDKLVVAHKHMLADRSEVFRRMFLWNVDDPKANEPIEIRDTSYAAFEMFIDVIYFGTVPSNSEMCLEMIVLAEKYDIPDIKAAVEMSAIALMNSDNVINMLITSELHKAHRMKKVALEFCAKNPVHEISNVQDLTNYPDLMVEVLTYNQKHLKIA